VKNHAFVGPSRRGEAYECPARAEVEENALHAREHADAMRTRTYSRFPAALGE